MICIKIAIRYKWERMCVLVGIGKKTNLSSSKEETFTEWKRDSCGKNRKYSRLGSVDERWSFREFQQYRKRRKGLSSQRQNRLGEYKDRI